MAIAGLSLIDPEVRRKVSDAMMLLPAIRISLNHPRANVRFAACQCVRALSRAVAVLRTSIIDSGLGMAIFEMFRRKDEDRRVTYAALSAVINLLNDFSPLRQVYSLVFTPVLGFNIF